MNAHTTPTAPAAPDPAPTPEPGTTGTDLDLCPIRVGDHVTHVAADDNPAARGKVIYVSDYNYDGVIECLLELPDGGRAFAPPWALRPVDGDPDDFAARMAVLVAAQRVTAARVLDHKRDRALTLAREIASTVAAVIDDLDNDRIPDELGARDEFGELEDALREASEYQELALVLDLLDQTHPTGTDHQPTL